jgi:hypothetical protein
MFAVTDAAAIRTVFEQGGELAAAVELRRLFPAITDHAEAREYARYTGISPGEASTSRSNSPRPGTSRGGDSVRGANVARCGEK